MLKAELKIESELRYQLQLQTQSIRNEDYNLQNDKIQSDKDYEREFIKMDKIYKEFEKIVRL